MVAASLPDLRQDQLFRDDFRRLLQFCRDLGPRHGQTVQLIPSFISFEWCRPAELINAERNGCALEPHRGQIAGGRASFITDPDLRSRLLRQMLVPLLDVASGFRDVLYAFEVVNEPDWVVRDGDVSGRDMARFIAEAIDCINRREIPATVGFADPHWGLAWAGGGSDESGVPAPADQDGGVGQVPLLSDAGGLGRFLEERAATGRYIHQFHYYTQRQWRTGPPGDLHAFGGSPGPLGPHHRCPITPCIIGEFATAPPLEVVGAWHPHLAKREDLPPVERVSSPAHIETGLAPWPEINLPSGVDRLSETDSANYLAGRIRAVAELDYPVACLWSGMGPVNDHGLTRRPDAPSEWSDLQKEQVQTTNAQLQGP